GRGPAAYGPGGGPVRHGDLSPTPHRLTGPSTARGGHALRGVTDPRRARRPAPAPDSTSESCGRAPSGVRGGRWSRGPRGSGTRGERENGDAQGEGQALVLVSSVPLLEGRG